jgi:uncharacterized protein (DUF433 family)
MTKIGKTRTSHGISRTPSVCGGRPTVEGTGVETRG